MVMKLDESGKIIHFQDRWNDMDMPSNFLVFVSAPLSNYRLASKISSFFPLLHSLAAIETAQCGK